PPRPRLAPGASTRPGRRRDPPPPGREARTRPCPIRGGPRAAALRPLGGGPPIRPPPLGPPRSGHTRLREPAPAVAAAPGPPGKVAALNEAVPLASGEILVLTDARQSLAPDAVRRLVAYFADPTVGAVSGELHLLPSPGSPVEGVGLYWKYEKLIRKAESRFDSTVGVTGAFYALRKELFLPIDPRTILDDVAIPMRVALAGRRVLFAPEARAWDHVEESAAREYRRKVRTLAGNYQLVALYPALLHPLRNRLLWQLASHKLARLAVPWCLLVLFLASARL